MDFLSRIRFESKIVPGAVVTFKRVTATTRATFLESLGKSRSKIREIQRERKPLDDEYQAAIDKARREAKAEVDKIIKAEQIDRAEAEKRVPPNIEFPDDKFAELVDLRGREEQLLRDSLGQATLRAAFVSIEGVTVDGHIPTVDELIESAPVEFTDELIAAANGIAGLSPQERGESPWLGTSAQPEVGPSPNTTAPSAGETSEAA